MSKKDYFQKAAKYGLLADYYKYSNPGLHVYYYYKHLNSLNKAVMQRSDNAPILQTDPAKIRILHAAPDAGNVDVYVNETRILQNTPYKTVSDYLSLPEGRYQIDIYPTGNLVANVLSQKVTIQSGKQYTASAVGLDKQIRLVLIEDLPFVPTNEAKVRVVHLSPDAPAVDIAVKGGDVLFPKLAYRKATNYVGITPMTIDLEARIAGSNEVALSLNETEFLKDTAYSIYIIGKVKGSPELEVLFLAP